MTQQSRARSPGRVHKPHLGEEVQVGAYTVRATGTLYNAHEHFGDYFDAPGIVLVSLSERFPGSPGCLYQLLWAPLDDYEGVPKDWEDFLRRTIIPMLEDGQRLLAYCEGGHGRTGTFLASLIAILETPEMTPDPIAAMRERHCREAVETFKQAQAIFALRGQLVPPHYNQLL